MKRKYIILSLYIFILIIGVCGCMKRNTNTNVNYADSAVSFAKDELKKRYSLDFEIEDLSKRENGPFKTKEYIGYAYIPGDSAEKFTIWVNMDERTVIDSYYCLSINEFAIDWLNLCANSIWQNSQLSFWSLMVREPSNSLSNYTESNLQKYFTDELSSNKIYLTIPEYSENESEKIQHFISEISNVSNGVLYIKYEDYPDKEQIALSLAANASDIVKALEKWED